MVGWVEVVVVVVVLWWCCGGGGGGSGGGGGGGVVSSWFKIDVRVAIVEQVIEIQEIPYTSGN